MDIVHRSAGAGSAADAQRKAKESSRYPPPSCAAWAWDADTAAAASAGAAVAPDREWSAPSAAAQRVAGGGGGGADASAAAAARSLVARTAAGVEAMDDDGVAAAPAPLLLHIDLRGAIRRFGSGGGDMGIYITAVVSLLRKLLSRAAYGCSAEASAPPQSAEQIYSRLCCIKS